MICARCDERIRDDDEYETVNNLGATGSGGTFFRHTYRCRRAQTQTAPYQSFRERGR